MKRGPVSKDGRKANIKALEKEKHGDGVVAWPKGDELMKIGLRKPSIKKRVSARISPKRQLVHRLGIKMPRGYGWIRSPKRFVYNKVYRRTSFDVFKLFKKLLK